jgi:hypothetical protein
MGYNREKFFSARILDTTIRNIGRLWESSSVVIPSVIFKSIIWLLATGEWVDLGGWKDNDDWIDD